MTKWVNVVVALLALPAVAAEVRSTSSTRVGQPVQKPSRVVGGAVYPAELHGTHTRGGAFLPLLEVELDKDTYNQGDSPTVIVRLKRAAGTPIENADVTANDQRETRPRKVGYRGQGEYTATLDSSPGEHFVDIEADAVVDGTSVQGGVSTFYVVATGHMEVLGIGPTRQDATTLYVPLDLRCTEQGWYSFHGALVSKNILVAGAETTAVVRPGDEGGIEFGFGLSDLVENPGPYTLSDVFVPAGRTGWWHTGYRARQGRATDPGAARQQRKAAHTARTEPGGTGIP